MTERRDDEFKGQPTMLGDCACGCMNKPDFSPPPDGLPDRLAIARDDLRRESARTEMAFRERDEWRKRAVLAETMVAKMPLEWQARARAALSSEDATRPTPAPKVVGGTGIHSPSEVGAVLRRNATRPTPGGKS